MKIAGLLTTVFLLLFGAVPVVFAENSNGGITSEMIEKMYESTRFEGPMKVIYNSLINNDIKDLALDHDKVVDHQDLFNVSIKTKGVTNQKSSGRCWLFASLNLLRPMMIEKYDLSSFEFSESYLAFWDKLEKANLFLEVMIELRDRDPLDRELNSFLRSPFGDGGWWHYTVDLIEKYGCVPKEVMPETQSTSKTRMMNKLISTKLRKCASELRELYAEGASLGDLRAAKEDMLMDIYHMLVLNMGIPPIEFVWRYEDKDSTVSEPRKFTPKEFYRKVVDVDLRDYITMTDHPSRPKYEMYSLKYGRDMFDHKDGSFMNLPIDSLKAYALETLLDGEAVVFACDVGEANANEKGIFRPGIYDYESVYGVDLGMDKRDKFIYGDLTANHMMLISACDTLNGRVQKWKVENSWGTDRGDGGFWTMYDDWFNDNVFEVIVHKKHLSGGLRKILKKEPIELPVWDPYSQCINK